MQIIIGSGCDSKGIRFGTEESGVWVHGHVIDSPFPPYHAFEVNDSQVDGLRDFLNDYGCDVECEGSSIEFTSDDVRVISCIAHDAFHSNTHSGMVELHLNAIQKKCQEYLKEPDNKQVFRLRVLDYGTNSFGSPGVTISEYIHAERYFETRDACMEYRATLNLYTFVAPNGSLYPKTKIDTFDIEG